MAAAISVILAVACNHTETKLTSSGEPGEVIVVIEKSNWEGPIGAILRETLESDYPFLPQREPRYSLINITHNAFSNLFQAHRNIIIVNIDKDAAPGITSKYNVWAKPQCVIYIDAIDKQSALTMLSQKKDEMLKTIEQAERNRVIANSKKYEETRIAPEVNAMADGSPHFPTGYAIKKKTKNFIWVTYDTQYSSQGIFVYKTPYKGGKDALSLDNIIQRRNEVLKNNVPGMFENTYMTTSSFATPAIEYLKHDGREIAQIRGLWEVENDFMGGPFISHSFYSPDGKYIITIEGFVYAPKYNKREYLRQVESIIYSFEWKKNSEKSENILEDKK